MHRFFAVTATLALLAGAAFGDDALLAQFRASADGCWASVRGQPERIEDCADLVYEACSASPQGQSNLGMSQCLYAEAAFWDERLNAVWRQVIPKVREADARDRAYEPELAVREDKLRAAERAWIGFRDAQCDFEYSLAGGGSIRQLFYPSCLATETRTRVKNLVGLGQEFGL